ncbi:MAG: purine-binding chemotaxis protein CheW [Prolixibacteraceae bacterium]|nr:purine-binding chemotaxis protein CheW [Prolixibacteraceae bacterium]
MNKKFILFQLNKQQFALPLPVVERVVQMVEIVPLPKAPEYIPGVINSSGEIIPVIDIRLLFGMKHREVELSDQLIITVTSQIKFALWVDVTYEVDQIESSRIEKGEKIKYGEKFVQGIAKLDDGMVLIADVDKFLSEEELKQLEVALAK